MGLMERWFGRRIPDYTPAPLDVSFGMVGGEFGQERERNDELRAIFETIRPQADAALHAL